MRLFLSLCAAAALAGETRLHHVHLLAPDPAAVVDFYASRFTGGKRGKVLGLDAVETPRGAIVVSPVSEVRPGQTALWHLGWGATDVRAEYIRQLDLRTPVAHPLEHLMSELFFSYFRAPQDVEVEVVSAKVDGFVHLHLYSRHPHIAGEWYARYLGLRVTRPLSSEPVTVGRFTLSSAAYLDAGGVSFLVWPKPAELAELQPSDGTAVDHLAFTVDNLDQKILDLRKSGARILELPKPIAPGVRAAMVQGPDRMKVELIETSANP